ncbi:hypothetical protein OAG71_04800 [bacterium]|nr:hypothetical protein [bacterium]
MDNLTSVEPRYRRYRDLWMGPSSTSADLRPQLGAAVAITTNRVAIRRYAKSRSSNNAIDKPNLRSTCPFNYPPMVGVGLGAWL